jgi:hypothetical protein
MTRSSFLITAVLFCLATAAMAADQKNKDAQPQSSQTEQIQVARKDASGSMDTDASISSDCVTKTSPRTNQNSAQDDSEGDPAAPQNQVEYGGGG